MLDKVRDTIVAAYRWKSSLKEEDLIALMDDETWMGADDAVKNGFADEKIEAVQAAASIDADKLARMPNVPEKFRERVQALVRATPAPNSTPKDEPNGEPAKPTAEDVRAAALEITELCKKAGVADMRDGYDWRRERDQKDLAILLATIMNASWRFRRWIQPGELLEKPKPEARAETRSTEDRAAELDWLKKKLHHGN